MKKYWPLIPLLAVLAPNIAAAATCDRGCLRKTLDTYLEAVLKHDPSKATLDAAFRYTENSMVVAPGEGLWKTATALGKVQRRYGDAVNGQAVYFGHIELGDA